MVGPVIQAALCGDVFLTASSSESISFDLLESCGVVKDGRRRVTSAPVIVRFVRFIKAELTAFV